MNPVDVDHAALESLDVCLSGDERIGQIQN